MMTNLVSFPGLGLEFSLNRIAFEVFDHPVYWYGVIIAVGFLLAVSLTTRLSPSFGIDSDFIYDYLIFAVPLGLAGARAYYVLFYLDLYRNLDGSFDVAAMFRISDGGIAIYGGLIAAALTLVVFCRVKRANFLALADLGAMGLFVGQSIGRWGNFMNVEAYGGLTDAPWRMTSASIANEMFRNGYATQEQATSILEGTLGVHPTFLYESVWNLMGFVIVCLIIKKGRKFDGQIFFTYLTLYGLGRFWIEGMRSDSLYFFGLELFGMPVRTSQVVALVSMIVGGGLLLWKLKQPNPPENLHVNRVALAEAAEIADAAEEQEEID